jgi:hypothetical protein
MRKLTPAAALLVSAVLAAPAGAQITAAAASTGTASRPTPFSFTPTSYTYTVVDTSKAVVPTTATSSATTLGNSMSRPVNVTGALQQSNSTMRLANTDPTRALQPRQQTSMFQIPNVFSRISTVNLIPNFFRTRTTTSVFPTPGPQQSQ